MKNMFRMTVPSLLTVLLLASPSYAQTGGSDDIATLKAQIAKLAQKVDQLEAQQKKSAAAVKAAKPATVAAAATPGAPLSMTAAPPTGPTPLAVTTPVPVVSVTSAGVSSFALTKEDPAAPATITADDVVTKGVFPGSFHIPGTSTSVRIGGIVKLDANTDIGTGYGAPFRNDSNIPLKTDPRTQQSEQTTFGAQQSRVTLDTRTPTDYGEVRAYFEGDFYGAAGANGNTNGYGFQLRHAYGSIGAESTGQFLAGQTWSNYIDEFVVPDTLDYLGPAGRLFVRQPQIRYTQAVGPVTLSGSVETGAVNTGQTSNPAEVSSATVAGTTITPRNTMPDLVVRGDYHYVDNGYISLRGLANETNVDRTTAVVNNNTNSAYGYGVSLSGKQGVLEKDSVIYNGYVGKGTGRYVYNIGVASSYYNPTTDSLVTLPYYGGTLGYQHYWSTQFRSSVFGGGVRLVNDTSVMTAPVEALANKYILSGSANLIWQPVPAYSVGVEYSHGYRKVETGLEGNLDRIETSFIYNF